MPGWRRSVDHGHTRAAAERRLLEPVKFGTAAPSGPSVRRAASAAESAFDQQYVVLEVADQQQDIEEAKTEIAEGATPEIRDAASTDLPVLQQHLALAQGLQATVGTATPVATPAS